MSSTNASPQILLTGATGYIGGSVLTSLLNSPSPVLSAATITCLVRGQDRAVKLTSAYGDRVRPVVYKDLDDIEATVAAAAQHDVVINATLGYHPASAQALLRGLAQRKASTGRDVWMIQTSGTSNLADRPVTRIWVEDQEGREFDDATDDVYGYEKDRETDKPYLQRTTELGVVDTGLELGVKTLVIMSPTIFGTGTGLFHNTSIQIPAYTLCVLRHGHAVVVGDGKGVWDHVHMKDLADLYLIMVWQIVEKGGESVPSGKKGIIFSGNGRHSWLEMTQAVAATLHEEGKIAGPQVQSIGVPEAAKVLSLYLGGVENEEYIELGFASNARTVSSVARNLGWKPTRGEDAWKEALRHDVKYVLESKV
ncbi:NAD dependent epimerase/dehydratase family protein [Hypoxylon sp. NC1633]|nr:NAD dependent epimerase/dehydratase family protein [Hypoxylon sp. NC1633]